MDRLSVIDPAVCCGVCSVSVPEERREPLFRVERRLKLRVRQVFRGRRQSEFEAVGDHRSLEMEEVILRACLFLFF